MHVNPIRGKTVQWTYRDGPTAGTTFEHTFGRDGHVAYRIVDNGKVVFKDNQQDAPHRRHERRHTTQQESPTYEAHRIRDDIWAVAYLAPSGYTLTTILDLATDSLLSFASNEQSVTVQRGTFRLVDPKTDALKSRRATTREATRRPRAPAVRPARSSRAAKNTVHF